MLTLQHLPVTSSSFFSSPLASPATPNQAPLPSPMADSGSLQYRPRRSSRSPLNPNPGSPPSTSSSYAAFPKFHLADLPTPSSQNPPALSSTGSRLRFGESWNDNDIYSSSNFVPESLLTSALPRGRFVQTLRGAPAVVATLISFLYGSYEVLSFCHASKETRRLVESLFENNDAVRDAFLTRSISGYQASSGPKSSWLNHAIKIDLTDLELLLESNSVSLAVYPTHALRIITSPQSSMSSADAGENDNATERFQTLTLSHSRFVAYLRNRTAPQALQLASQDEDDVMLPSPDSSTGGPELVFPSPLFYFKDVEAPITPAYLPLPSTTTTSAQAKSLSKETGKNAARLAKSKSTSNFRPSTAESETSAKPESRLKRLSLKPRRKSTALPPPPPSAMPAIPGLTVTPLDMSQFGTIDNLAGHSMSRSFDERARSNSQNSMAPMPHTISHSYHSSYGRYTPPPTGQYTPPGSSAGWNTPPPPISFGGRSNQSSISGRRRRTRQSFHIAESSGSSAFGPSQVLNRSMPFLPGTSPTPGAATPMNGSDPTSPSGDIHALSQVFRQTRAPIFRVFVPCSRLTPTVRQACMTQLHAASLVPHLRAGDLVCNLGYVPDTGADELASGNVTVEADGSGDCRGWMVFSGHELCPLSTRVAIPVRDPTFILTAPHYFSHVLLGDENPRFEMVIPLVPAERSQPHIFSLMRETRSVVAPRNKGATAAPAAGGEIESPRKHKINRFVWVARVECARWGSEWLIEAEGTKEGREYIEGALEDSRRGAEREWEVIRERTGRGRVYVRKV